MKRSAPLRARKPLRRRAWLRARGNTKYRRRPRDTERMLWTKRQPCMVRTLPPRLFVQPLGRAHAAADAQTPCFGPVEADHMGARGLGQKADDATCVSMCRGHHRERTDHTGTFYPLTRDELRAWRTEAITRTQAAWRNR